MQCLRVFCHCRFEGEITADELAGLSCIDDVESRIISYKQSTTASDADNTAAAAEAAVEWSVRHGPFDDDTFDDPELGDSNWTLLVNEANRHLPEVSDLLTNFEFVPNWRVDDIMISYATTGGGVGPHVDSYDVFLLQGSGQRQWSIGVYIPTKYSFTARILVFEGRETSYEEEQDRLVQDIDVRVLGDFAAKQTWTLSAGDVLYLPPRWAHHGISLDEDCMTYSIGFSAPSHRDMITYFTDTVAEHRVAAGTMYTDTELVAQSNPGMIAPAAVAKAKSAIRSAVLSALDDDVFFADWFGSYVTKSRRDHTIASVDTITCACGICAVVNTIGITILLHCVGGALVPYRSATYTNFLLLLIIFVMTNVHQCSGYPEPLEPDNISTVYGSPSAVVEAIKRAKINTSKSSKNDSVLEQGPFLYRTEGLTFSYIEHSRGKGATLFIDGHRFPLPSNMSFAAALLCKSARLTPRDLQRQLTGIHGGELAQLIQQLLLANYMYSADD
eukprot:11804-Heterococcus_DN1.PRE.3